MIRGLEKKQFKGAREAIDRVLEIDNKRKEAQVQVDALKAQVNSLSKSIGGLMKEGKKDEAETVKQQVADIKAKTKELEEVMKQAEDDKRDLLCTIPNVPYDLVPEGKSAEDNLIVKTGGHDTVLPENALPHWELAKKYNLIDFDLGVKISGAGFPVYIGQGARLQRALINFFLDEARAAGYTEIMPPTVVNQASGYGTGQLPDKEGQMYHCELDDLYLIPTAEVPVTNIYRDVILNEDQLPIKNCAYTQCFRREAGSYGKDVRGLNRLHEFSKIEIVRIDKPEHSEQSHQEMLAHVEGLLQKLELPYRILRLCGGDMSFTAVSATTSKYTARLRSVGWKLALFPISILIRPTVCSVVTVEQTRRFSSAIHSTVQLWLCPVSWPLCSKTSRLPKASVSRRQCSLTWDVI